MYHHFYTFLSVRSFYETYMKLHYMFNLHYILFSCLLDNCSVLFIFYGSLT